MDTRSVGEEIMARKQELMGQMDGAGQRMQ
jgi:hypothetical protein